MYEIVKGVALPNKKHPRLVLKYPVEQMEVGDHFVIPYADVIEEDIPAEKMKVLRRASQVSRNAAKLFAGERKFLVRSLKTGVGVWRVL